MTDKNLRPNEDEKDEQETKILRNDDYPGTKDSAVVIEEPDRTVFLSEDEVFVIDKDEMIPISPKNRPRKVYAGMWGTTELITVGLALFPVLLVIILYLFFVLPEQRQLDQNRAKSQKMEKELASAKTKWGDITSTESQVAKLITSVEDIENRYLKEEMVGRTAVYQRINALINAYGLVNTTGPDYTPLEISESERRQGVDSGAQRGRSKFQSLFPGIYVTTTVEGSYQNLRRFIRDIETSEEFIMISMVELQPAESEEKEGGQATATQTSDETDKTASVRGKVRGGVVSLRMEMAVYFRRPNDQRLTTTLNDGVAENNPQPR